MAKKVSKNKKREKVFQWEDGTTFKMKEAPIKLTLKVLGRTFESYGATAQEALDNLKPEQWVKGAGVLTIKKVVDGKEVVREKIIAGNHIRNLFGMASGTMKEISLKWVRSLLE